MAGESRKSHNQPRNLHGMNTEKKKNHKGSNKAKFHKAVFKLKTKW